MRAVDVLADAGEGMVWSSAHSDDDYRPGAEVDVDGAWVAGYSALPY